MEITKKQICPFRVGERVVCIKVDKPMPRENDWPGVGWRMGRAFIIARITNRQKNNDFILWPKGEAGIYATAVEQPEWDQ